MGALKVRGKVAEISFEEKFLRKAMKSQEIRRNLLALLLHNTVPSLKHTYQLLTTDQLHDSEDDLHPGLQATVVFRTHRENHSRPTIDTVGF